MELVDEFAAVRAEIQRLETRAEALRQALLEPGVRLRSNRNEVVLRHSTRRSFQRDLLPPELLNAPRFWKESRLVTVSVRPLAPGDEADLFGDLAEEGPTLVEPFDP